MTGETSEAKVRDFYTEVLKNAGYQPEPDQALAFRKDGDLVTVHLVQKNKIVSVYITRKNAGLSAQP